MPHPGERRIEPLTAGTLVLEPVTRAHAAELLAPLREPSLYEFAPEEPPANLAALEQRFSRLEIGLSPDSSDTCFCWVIRQNGAAAGLVQATCNGNGQAFVAYETFSAHRRQGVAGTAVAAVLAFLARATATTQVLAYVDTANVASIRLLASLGFTKCRLIPGASYVRGEIRAEFEFEHRLNIDF